MNILYVNIWLYYKHINYDDAKKNANYIINIIMDN